MLAHLYAMPTMVSEHVMGPWLGLVPVKCATYTYSSRIPHLEHMLNCVLHGCRRRSCCVLGQRRRWTIRPWRCRGPCQATGGAGAAQQGHKQRPLRSRVLCCSLQKGEAGLQLGLVSSAVAQHHTCSRLFRLHAVPGLAWICMVLVLWRASGGVHAILQSDLLVGARCTASSCHGPKVYRM